MAFAILAGCDTGDPTTDQWRAELDPARPPSVAADFTAPDDVVIDVQPEAAIVEALDADGEIIGRLGLVYEEEGITRVVSEYADGVLIVDVNLATKETTIVEQTIDAEEADRRARLIEDTIAVRDGSEPQAFNPWSGWAGCGVGAVLTVVACVPTPATVWALARCPITAAGATCACIKAANDGKAKKPCGKENK